MIRSELAVIDGQAYRVAGMPIRGQGGVVPRRHTEAPRAAPTHFSLEVTAPP
ncbi:MAG: hypothetical protein KIT72_01890 [Polyangiaceae bacterium]|nr:hypothetical protein [Polyangiaceae bacterium]MCW5789149.1 hypothetical protein [Polyangiaceae bacterium]